MQPVRCRKAGRTDGLCLASGCNTEESPPSNSSSGALLLVSLELFSLHFSQHDLQPGSSAPSTEQKKVPWSPPSKMQQQQVTVTVYGKGSLSRGVFYRSARSRREAEGQALILGERHHVLSSTWQKDGT